MNQILWTIENFEKVWNELQAGDLIMGYSNTRDTSSGQKILVKYDEVIVVHDNNLNKKVLENKISYKSAMYFRKNNNIDPMTIFKSFNPNKFMSTITSIIKKLVQKEPEKTFAEVGFIDETESITEGGKEALFYLLWKEKKEELKKLADEIKAENNK